jgi:DNA repair protein RecN (Recombination protein N)
MEAGWRNMLTNLHVKNLALIEEENVDFEEGLNILSGETGAGKSIILGSINAALGAKTSPDFIRTGAEYGLAELMFDIGDKKTLDKIKELGVLDIEDGELLISRKITPTRSQIKVNGQNFTAAQTQKLARYLIDMHGQHDNQILMDDSAHINVVDEYCLDDISALKEMMKNDYQHYVECKNELSEMDKDNDERQREISFLEYEVNEITAAGLKKGEDEELEAQFKKLNNRQKIMNELSGADMLLNSGEDNISDMLGMVVKALVNAAEYDESLKNPLEMLQDVESLIMDVSHDISTYIDDSDYDDAALNDIQYRLDTVNELKNKYGGTIENVFTSLKQKEKKLDEYYNYDEILKKRQEAYENAYKKALQTAEMLSDTRKKAADRLTTEFIESLKNLNFLDVRFRIDFEKSNNITSNGYDLVRFMISTNPGQDLRPLSKIASGGELSRIMLAIKTVMAGDDSKTLIFDEIDAGISGRTAQMVSNQLARLSRNHQIICITHLPQIASMADAHYTIEKTVHDNKTYSQISRVDKEDSIYELARMLSGSEVTASVLANARELKKTSEAFKDNMMM